MAAEHCNLMGNPKDRGMHKSDYAEIIKEAYKNYISELFSELVASMGDGAPSRESIDKFRVKLNNARRASMIALEITIE